MDSRRNGFTMVELLVVIAVLAILATIAMPSYTTFIAKNRADTETSDLYRAFNYARLEAIDRGRNVRITPVTAGLWTGNLNVTMSAPLAGDPAVLRQLAGMSSKSTLTFSTTSAYIEFNNLGALNFPTSALTLTYTQGTVSRSMGVCLNGRVVLSGTCT